MKSITKNWIMTAGQLREIWSAVPFHPLTIHMVDGKEVEVPQPDHLFFVQESELILIVGREEGKRQFRFLTPDRIASVER